MSTSIATAPMQRILTTPLKATERGGMSSVRIANDNFHVATISAGMNDQFEYARLFAASPNLLAAAIAVVDVCNPLPLNSKQHVAFALLTNAIAEARGRS